MIKYFATVRLADGRPQQCTVEADTIFAALDLVCKRAGVKSTTDLLEFELLEVLGNDRYRSAARKVVNSPVLDTNKLDPPSPPPKKHSEAVYHPYKVRTV